MSESAGLSPAMRFLAATRSDSVVREQLERLDPWSGLGPVIELARACGFEFTEDDLRAAHAHDWGLRRMRYLGEGLSPSAVSTVAVVNRPSSST